MTQTLKLGLFAIIGGLALILVTDAQAQNETGLTVKGNDTSEDSIYNGLRSALPLPPGVHSRGARASGQTIAGNPAVALSINFGFASSEVLPDSRDLILRLAHVMMRDDMLKDRFQIVGHTDSVGTTESNMQLSLRRAQAVLDVLVQNGVDRYRLLVSGHGSAEPLNISDPRAAENRRVEIINLGE